MFQSDVPDKSGIQYGTNWKYQIQGARQGFLIPLLFLTKNPRQEVPHNPYVLISTRLQIIFEGYQGFLR